MTNIDFFKYSLENPDDLVDCSATEGMLVISKDRNSLATDLMKADHELIECIASYNVLLKDEKSMKHLSNMFWTE